MALTIICLKCIKAVEIIDTTPSPRESDKRIAIVRCHDTFHIKHIYRWWLNEDRDTRETLTGTADYGWQLTESAKAALHGLLANGEQFDFFMRALEQCGDTSSDAKTHATDMAKVITDNYQLLERLSQRLLALVQRVEKTRS